LKIGPLVIATVGCKEQRRLRL